MQKTVSKKISTASPDDRPALLEEAKNLAAAVKDAEAGEQFVEQTLRAAHLAIPNVIEDAPPGGEDDFLVLEKVGSKPVVDESARAHRDRRRPARHRHGARGQGQRQPLLLPHRGRRRARTRAGQPRDGAGARGRVHPGHRPRAGQARDDGGHRLPRRARERGLQAGRRRPLPRRHQRGRAGRVPLRRDPRRRRPAAALRRLLVLLPARGRLTRQGHQGHHPGALVRQGRDVLLRPGRGRGGRAPAAAGLGTRVHRQARTGLPGHRRGRRRPRLERGPQVRHRGLVPVPERLSRADVDVELHDVPGPPAQHQNPRGRAAPTTGRHAERHAVRGRAHHRLPARSPPAARRVGVRAGGAASVARRPRGR